MIAFAAAIAEVVELLEAAGVNATAEAKDIRLPGVWVGGVSSEPSRLSGENDYLVDLYLVTKTAGNLRTYAQLDELATKVATVVDLADGRGIDVTSVALPGSPAVPAYRYPITVTI